MAKPSGPDAGCAGMAGVGARGHPASVPIEAALSHHAVVLGATGLIVTAAASRR